MNTAPSNIDFGGGTSTSIYSPTALIIILIAGILVCLLPRNRVIIPFFLAAILIPMDQVLLVGPYHFPLLRILALFGLSRVLWRKFTRGDDVFSGGMNGIDIAMIVLTFFTGLDGVLLWRVWGEFVFQVGTLLTPVGVYFLLRSLIRDEEDVRRTLRVWAWAAVVVAADMVFEHLIGQNPIHAALGGAHAFLGNVSERNGSLRASGTFDHPILAGAFGGMSVPLFVGLWWSSKKDRAVAAMGFAAAAVIPLLTSSSTALMGLVAAIIGLCFWGLRRSMRAVRWGIVGVLLADQLRFQSNFWHLINDIDLTGSSSSWHRFMLVDECIKHFFDWFLIGTRDYASWGWQMWDLSNEYVLTADRSGLIPLLALITILVLGFKYLARARVAAETAGNEKLALLTWALGASLFANLIAFIGIDYFDQTMVAWYAVLALICAVTSPPVRVGAEKSTVAVAKPGFLLKPSLASGSMRDLRSAPRMKPGLQSKN
jgi:hypothetical protein